MTSKKEKKSNGQFILLLLGIVIFLVVTAVVAFCVLSFLKQHNQKTKTVTNTITMNYTSNVNGISVTPISSFDDATGKLLQNDENIFDFVVNAKVENGTKVDYEIIAIKDSMSTIPDNKVRIYLQKSDVSSYASVKDILLPTNYKNSNNIKLSDSSGMILDAGTYKKTKITYYRLKIWVDPSYASKTQNDYFKIKVNIYAKA
ncbi:MAG: hypothetical protein IKO49_00925 [Bacilli bacterium]|nr:hypothetical protein [Bacilli bacterium]